MRFCFDRRFVEPREEKKEKIITHLERLQKQPSESENPRFKSSLGLT